MLTGFVSLGRSQALTAVAVTSGVSLLGLLALGKLGFLPDITRGFANLQKQHAGPDEQAEQKLPQENRECPQGWQ